MAVLHINLEAEGMLKHIPDEKIAQTSLPMDVGVLEGGMASGRPAVYIAVHLEQNGGTAVGQCSMAHFLMAALAMYARYGDAGTGITIAATG